MRGPARTRARKPYASGTSSQRAGEHAERHHHDARRDGAGGDLVDRVREGGQAQLHAWVERAGGPRHSPGNARRRARVATGVTAFATDAPAAPLAAAAEGAPHVHPVLRGGTVLRSAVLVAGLALFALGIALTLRSALGLGPWDVLHQGITEHLPLSFGQANLVVGIAVVLVSLRLGIRPGAGTVANAILVGLFVDAFLRPGVLPSAEHRAFAVQLAFDVAGVAVVAIATALYIGAALGAGPRDSFMLGLARRSGWRIGVARTSIEVSVLVLGALLGGSYGLGTAIFALGVGPCVQASFWALSRSPLVAR
jgi:uncharacterized membrane protein YczE